MGFGGFSFPKVAIDHDVTVKIDVSVQICQGIQFLWVQKPGIAATA